MGFSLACILGEFVEASRLAVYVSSASMFGDMVEQQNRYDRARKLRAYHALHARPEWRKARAKKMRDHRAAKKREADGSA